MKLIQNSYLKAYYCQWTSTKNILSFTYIHLFNAILHKGSNLNVFSSQKCSFLIRQNNYYLDTKLIDLETSHNNSQNFPHVFKTSVGRVCLFTEKSVNIICYTVRSLFLKKYFYLFWSTQSHEGYRWSID